MAAIVDTKTREIKGAKNPYELAHEQAHLSSFSFQLQYWQEISETAALIFVVLAFFFNPFKWLALIVIFIYIGLFILEEMWCDNEAKTSIKTD